MSFGRTPLGTLNFEEEEYSNMASQSVNNGIMNPAYEEEENRDAQTNQDDHSVVNENSRVRGVTPPNNGNYNNNNGNGHGRQHNQGHRFGFIPHGHDLRDIKPSLIHLLGQSQFGGAQNEDPHAHLAVFEEHCGTFAREGDELDNLKLKCFHLSLRDNARRG